MLDNSTYSYAEIRQFVAPRLQIVDTIETGTTFEWKLSDGRTISYAREPIDIGALAFLVRRTGNGKYFYKYTLDNRQVQMIRVGEVDQSFSPSVPASVVFQK